MPRKDSESTLGENLTVMLAVNLAALTTAFLVSFLSLPIIIRYSLKRNIVDIPDKRKIHKKVTPALGGIAIFVGFFISSLVWIDISQWGEIKFLLMALSIIFFIGIRDDLAPLKANIKLAGQIIAGCLLIFLFDLRLSSLYGILTIHEVPLAFSYVITLIAIIIITNSFNLIDGLDGLAGLISSVAFLCFGVWFFLIGDVIFSMIAFAMLGGILAFLFFNWDPSEVFMGDTGALVIGLLLSAMVIHFINTNFLLSDLSPFKFKSSVATATCFIIIPLVDTIRIIILRLSKGQSPLKPDKNHIHHAIMHLGISHGQSSIILGAIHVIYIAFAILTRNIGENWVLLGLILFSVALSVFLDLLLMRRKTTNTYSTNTSEVIGLPNPTDFHSR